MILLGDIASPSKELSLQLAKVFSENNLFKNKSIICNLEGLISDIEYNKDNKPTLFNHSSILETISNAGVKAVSLANNHTLDLAECYDFTVEALNDKKIQHTGAGKSWDDAMKEVTIMDYNQEVVMFSACWDFLLYNQTNPKKGVYIHTIDEILLIERIKIIREESKSKKILVFLHWSFDLEIIPFPMYRQWARALIDAGADFVIGCHSHCVQGGEKYKNGYIVYSLGNFFLPNHIYANGKLSFPDFARLQLAFEYDMFTNQAYCHWFRYIDDHTLHHIGTQNFEDSQVLKDYSPYHNMTDNQYLKYYIRNRRKRRFIPVYKNYHNIRLNQIFTAYLMIRAKFARYLAEKKLIKWQN